LGVCAHVCAVGSSFIIIDMFSRANVEDAKNDMEHHYTICRLIFLSKLIYKDPGSMFSEPLWSKV